MVFRFLERIWSIGLEHANDEFERMNVRLVNMTCSLGLLAAFVILSMALITGNFVSIAIALMAVTMLLAALLLTKKGYWFSGVVFCLIIAYTIIPFFVYKNGFTGVSAYLIAGGVCISLLAYKNKKAKRLLLLLSILSIIITGYLLYDYYDGFEMSRLGNLMAIPNMILALSIIYFVVNRINNLYIIQHKEYKELNTLKSRLISTLSHDLRSPLNSISGLIDLYESGAINKEELDPIMTEMNKQVKSTKAMLEEMLSWTKAQMEGTLNRELFDLNDLAKESIQKAELRAHQKDIKLKLSLKPSSTIFGDKEVVKLALRNLMNNALKFAPPGSGIIEVKVFKTEHKTGVLVEDNGKGISSEVLDKLINGRSISQAGSQNEKGIGLGLMLTRDFVEMNGGHLLIENIEGSGARFGIAFPSNS